MNWSSPLLDEFSRLSAISNHHRRGRKLEDLLERLFRQAHFRVQRNPGIARPRQTDLFASYGRDRYLIEAKWERDPLSRDAIDGVRSRLNRTDPSVIGVIFSASGFREGTAQDIVHRREQSILLFGEAELRRALESDGELLRLLRLKRNELITHGRVHLEGSPAAPSRRRRKASRLPEAKLRLVDADGAPQRRLVSGGGFGPFVFAQELPDIDWVTAGGNGVSLDLAIRAGDEDGLVRVLGELDGMGWITDQPRWNIQQSTLNWHGIGAQEFVDTLRSWKDRNLSLGEEAHHTEEVTYYDTCQGGFYTLTADISSHRYRRVSRCNLSFQLTGVPVDTDPIQHLCDALEAGGQPHFRPRSEPSVARCRPEGERVDLEVIAYVVEDEMLPDIEIEPLDDSEPDETSRTWVTGIVVRNPYQGLRPASAPKGWPGQCLDTELLVCALRSHHQQNDQPASYYLYHWEVAESSDATVFMPVAEW